MQDPGPSRIFLEHSRRARTQLRLAGSSQPRRLAHATHSRCKSQFAHRNLHGAHVESDVQTCAEQRALSYRRATCAGQDCAGNFADAQSNLRTDKALAQSAYKEQLARNTSRTEFARGTCNTRRALAVHSQRSMHRLSHSSLRMAKVHRRCHNSNLRKAGTPKERLARKSCAEQFAYIYIYVATYGQHLAAPRCAVCLQSSTCAGPSLQT